MRDSDFGGDVHSTVLNAVVLVCTESGKSFSFAFAMSPKLAIRQEQCESRCHAALILEAAPFLPGFITDTALLHFDDDREGVSQRFVLPFLNVFSPTIADSIKS